MPAYHVARSKIIDVPADKVMSCLKDFHEWPKWSPWLIMEPEAILEYSGKAGEHGSRYTWTGNLVGEGSMQLEDATEDQLDMELHFIKPFKSRAKVSFELNPIDQMTNVTWHMQGSLPFFMFFLSKKMQAWIGMDYDRGLLMLKDYLETGTVPSKILMEGVGSIQEQQYVGLENQCHMSDIGEEMSKDFEQLHELFNKGKWTTEIIPFTIYHHMDMVTKSVSYTAAIPVLNQIDVEAPFVTGKIDKSRALKVTHTGDYKHLGNAWSTANTVCRYQKMKTQKKIMGIERYMNEPADTPKEELVTEVLIPLRS